MRYEFYDVKIKEVVLETSDVKSFIFKKPKGYKFRPGQFFWVSHNKKGQDKEQSKVPMAIASGTNEKDLMFTMRSWGQVTNGLFKLMKGDKISISDALGTYLPFNNFIGANLYLIAGGTGITPIRSVLTSMQNEKLKSRSLLMYGAKTPGDFLFKKELSHWNPQLIVETKSESEKWTGMTGYVTKLLTEEMDSKHGICFVCGPMEMMKNTVSILKSLGFTEGQIYVSIEKIVNNQVIGPVFPLSDENVSF